ncbi:hypothetical protein B7R87_22620 [Streptomyces tsukubensis]|nr:hypothetical protein B7R87_22620 [Streptomyces tsukubensis]EIF92349.1 lipoprotein [Streptomyces tsukubensis NRRL18488]
MTLRASVFRTPAARPRPPFRAGTRPRRALLAVVLSAGLMTGLVSCAAEEDPDQGTNGVGKLTAVEIETRARAAADAAKAVRLSGTLVSKGGTYKLNMRLKDGGGSGSVTTDDHAFELLRIGDDLYLKADAAFWSDRGTGGSEPSEADAAAAGKLGGKYVRVPRGDAAYQQFRGFTEKDGMLDGFLGMEGELGKGDRTKIGNVRTVKVTADEGKGGVLDVSLDGQPYPVRFARAGGAGVLTLAEWDVDFPLAPPARAAVVDYGKDLRGSREGKGDKGGGEGSGEGGQGGGSG